MTDDSGLSSLQKTTYETLLTSMQATSANLKGLKTMEVKPNAKAIEILSGVSMGMKVNLKIALITNFQYMVECCTALSDSHKLQQHVLDRPLAKIVTKKTQLESHLKTLLTSGAVAVTANLFNNYLTDIQNVQNQIDEFLLSPVRKFLLELSTKYPISVSPIFDDPDKTNRRLWEAAFGTTEILCFNFRTTDERKADSNAAKSFNISDRKNNIKKFTNNVRTFAQNTQRYKTSVAVIMTKLSESVTKVNQRIESAVEDQEGASAHGQMSLRLIKDLAQSLRSEVSEIDTFVRNLSVFLEMVVENSSAYVTAVSILASQQSTSTKLIYDLWETAKLNLTPQKDVFSANKLRLELERSLATDRSTNEQSIRMEVFDQSDANWVAKADQQSYKPSRPMIYQVYLAAEAYVRGNTCILAKPGYGKSLIYQLLVRFAQTHGSGSNIQTIVLTQREQIDNQFRSMITDCAFVDLLKPKDMNLGDAILAIRKENKMGQDYTGQELMEKISQLRNAADAPLLRNEYIAIKEKFTTFATMVDNLLKQMNVELNFQTGMNGLDIHKSNSTHQHTFSAKFNTALYEEIGNLNLSNSFRIVRDTMVEDNPRHTDAAKEATHKVLLTDYYGVSILAFALGLYYVPIEEYNAVSFVYDGDMRTIKTYNDIRYIFHTCASFDDNPILKWMLLSTQTDMLQNLGLVKTLIECDTPTKFLRANVIRLICRFFAIKTELMMFNAATGEAMEIDDQPPPTPPSEFELDVTKYSSEFPDFSLICSNLRDGVVGLMQNSSKEDISSSYISVKFIYDELKPLIDQFATNIASPMTSFIDIFDDIKNYGEQLSEIQTQKLAELNTRRVTRSATAAEIKKSRVAQPRVDNTTGNKVLRNPNKYNNITELNRLFASYISLITAEETRATWTNAIIAEEISIANSKVLFMPYDSSLFQDVKFTAKLLDSTVNFRIIIDEVDTVFDKATIRVNTAQGEKDQSLFETLIALRAILSQANRVEVVGLTATISSKVTNFFPPDRIVAFDGASPEVEDKVPTVEQEANEANAAITDTRTSALEAIYTQLANWMTEEPSKVLYAQQSQDICTPIENQNTVIFSNYADLNHHYTRTEFTGIRIELREAGMAPLDDLHGSIWDLFGDRFDRGIGMPDWFYTEALKKGRFFEIENMEEENMEEEDEDDNKIQSIRVTLFNNSDFLKTVDMLMVVQKGDRTFATVFRVSTIFDEAEDGISTFSDTRLKDAYRDFTTNPKKDCSVTKPSVVIIRQSPEALNNKSANIIRQAEHFYPVIVRTKALDDGYSSSTIGANFTLRELEELGLSQTDLQTYNQDGTVYALTLHHIVVAGKPKSRGVDYQGFKNELQVIDTRYLPSYNDYAQAWGRIVRLESLPKGPLTYESSVRYKMVCVGNQEEAVQFLNQMQLEKNKEIQLYANGKSKLLDSAGMGRSTRHGVKRVALGRSEDIVYAVNQMLRFMS